MSNDHENPKPRRRAWVWPSLVVGLIALQIGMSLTALALAVGDPAQAIVPDYYNRAVDWDQRRADLAASDALGWSVRFEISAPSGPLDRQTATITLADAQGQPVAVDSIEADVFHHARASNVQSVSFKPTGTAGRYAATVRMLRPGIWQVDVTARRGQDTLIESIEQIIFGGGG